MASIIRMSSDVFLDKFIKKHDYKKFNFLLISENIKTDKKYKNVYALKVLIPPPNVISEYVANGMSNKYVKKYFQYLSQPRVEALITVLVKLAVVENSDVILLCSKEEDEYEYLKLLCAYIEEVYGVDTCTYKKYKKDPKSCEIKKSKKIIKTLKEKLDNTAVEHATPTMSKKEMKARLNDLSKKELYAYCKQNSFKVSKDDSKSDMIKQIMKEYVI